MLRLRLTIAVLFILTTVSTGVNVSDAHTRIREVRCAEEETVQRAVDRARAGNVILVFGVCNENVVIRSSKSGITIRGGAAGSGITGVVFDRAVIDVRSATGIEVRGLAIQGPGPAGGPGSGFGGAGISLFDGASATVADCVIENNRGSGVDVNTSQAVLLRNMIRNNNLADLQPLGGVQVVFNGTAKLFDNAIEFNNRAGVVLRAQSNAFFTGGTIRGNRGDGLAVRQMSLANLEGATLTIADNQNFGIVCDGESRFSGVPGVNFVASGNPSGDVGCTHVR